MNRRILHVIVAIAILLPAAALLVHCGQPLVADIDDGIVVYADVNGSVVNQSGAYLGGTMIIATSPNVRISAETNSAGVFSLPLDSLKSDGSVCVEVFCAGYQARLLTGVTSVSDITRIVLVAQTPDSADATVSITTVPAGAAIVYNGMCVGRGNMGDISLPIGSINLRYISGECDKLDSITTVSGANAPQSIQLCN